MQAHDYDYETQTGTSPEQQTQQARQWAALCHASALLVFIGLPFGNLLGPLGVWLWKRNEYPFVDEQGKEALNFQISMTIYFFISVILLLVAIGVLLLLALLLAEIVLVIVAAVRASNGESFRYPLTIRLLR